MVSDFITERDGFLCLTPEEHQAAKLLNPNIPMAARQLLQYGESRDGYWTGERFMEQMENAVKVAEAKYPKDQSYRLYGFLIRVLAMLLSLMMLSIEIRWVLVQVESNH